MDTRPTLKDSSRPSAKKRAGVRFLERYRRSRNLQNSPSGEVGEEQNKKFSPSGTGIPKNYAGFFFGPRPKFPNPKNFAKPTIYLCISILYWDKPVMAGAYGILAIIEIWSHYATPLGRPRRSHPIPSNSAMESQKSQPLQARQAEAEMLLMTGGELQEMEQLAEDQKQSDLRGIEVWEWKMMKNGATAEQVEAERKRIDKETEDIIEG